MRPMVQTRTEYVCTYVSKYGIQWAGEKVVAETRLALHMYMPFLECPRFKMVAPI